MPLLSKFNQQCHHTPDSLAFTEGDVQLSYAQLQQNATIISQLLLSKNQHCQRVAIALNRGINASTAILAVLYTGSCYIPLDLKNPVARLNYIITDADCQIVIGKGSPPTWLENPDLWLDMDSTPLSNPLSLPPQLTSESLAAILYTSGSTGQPKGVAISHRAMLNFIAWATTTFDISSKNRIASLTPFYFDLSIFDLFCSLTNGASIHFIPDKLTFSPSRLSLWLGENKITTWYTVPSILSFLAFKGALKTTPLPSLTTILFAGEVFPTLNLINLCQLLPKVDFYNLYGPTETNVCCYWKIDRSRLQLDQPIPIGNSACYSTLNIASDNNELQVQSDNNLSGYWQKGKLIPALSVNNNYSTGDKVSINQYGEYCYHGRLDRMIKCSGFRVEPAEIEHAIMQSLLVEECAVIGISDSSSGHRPAAAVVLNKNVTLADIIKPIKQKLPVYMHPARFIELQSLPYLSNGKIDYQNLQTLFKKS